MALIRCGASTTNIAEVIAGVNNPTFGNMSLSFTTSKAYDKIIITETAFNTSSSSIVLSATVDGTAVTLNELSSYSGSFNDKSYFRAYELENVPSGAVIAITTAGGVNEHSILLAIG